jgi:catechol 2,3-dioxygenase-like lactoylglutathione lyase family enzyme
MIHHVSVGTNDLKKAKAFYDPLMAELGLRLIKESERLICYGLTETVFSVERPVDQQRATAGNGTHVAFHAGRRNVVRACYEVGLPTEGRTRERLPYDPNTTRTTTPASSGTRTATRSRS